MLRANELHSSYSGGEGRIKNGDLTDRNGDVDGILLHRDVLVSQMDEIKRFVPIATIM